MVRISIKQIEDCRATRPEGYADALIAAGSLNGDWLMIEQQSLDAVVRQYTPNRIAKVQGVGDLIHKVANPVAKAIDFVAGTNVQGCGGCAKRRENLNKMMPFSGTKI